MSASWRRLSARFPSDGLEHWTIINRIHWHGVRGDGGVPYRTSQREAQMARDGTGSRLFGVAASHLCLSEARPCCFTRSIVQRQSGRRRLCKCKRRLQCCLSWPLFPEAGWFLLVVPSASRPHQTRPTSKGSDQRGYNPSRPRPVPPVCTTRNNVHSGMGLQMPRLLCQELPAGKNGGRCHPDADKTQAPDQRTTRHADGCQHDRGPE